VKEADFLRKVPPGIRILIVCYYPVQALTICRLLVITVMLLKRLSIGTIAAPCCRHRG
jgi:hypothetical protein